MESFIKTHIDIGNILAIKCPSCGNKLEEFEIQQLIPFEYYEKFQKLSKREILLNNPYVKFCPQPDCEGYALGSIKNPKLTCETCKFEYCFLCVQKWHDEKCPITDDSVFESWVLQNNVKFCPRCKRRVIKNGGCPSMVCVCSYAWCWRCGQPRTAQFHEIFCYFGKDLWNIKFAWIFICVFAPVSLFFIPFIVLLAHADEFDYDSRIGKYWKIFFPLVFVFSPVITVGMLVAFIFIVAEKPGNFIRKSVKVVWLVPYGICLVISAVLVACGAVLAFFASFLGILFGIILLILRFSAERCGKKDYSIEFYPQNIL